MAHVGNSILSAIGCSRDKYKIHIKNIFLIIRKEILIVLSALPPRQMNRPSLTGVTSMIYNQWQSGDVAHTPALHKLTKKTCCAMRIIVVVERAGSLIFGKVGDRRLQQRRQCS